VHDDVGDIGGDVYGLTMIPERGIGASDGGGLEDALGGLWEMLERDGDIRVKARVGEDCTRNFLTRGALLRHPEILRGQDGDVQTAVQEHTVDQDHDEATGFTGTS